MLLIVHMNVACFINNQIKLLLYLFTFFQEVRVEGARLRYLREGNLSAISLPNIQYKPVWHFSISKDTIRIAENISDEKRLIFKIWASTIII